MKGEGGDHAASDWRSSKVLVSRYADSDSARASAACGAEAGSHLSLKDSCITQLKLKDVSRNCNESKDIEEEEDSAAARAFAAWVQGCLAHKKPRPRRTLQEDCA